MLLKKLKEMIMPAKEEPKKKMIPVKMPDGTIEEYAPSFIITDGEHCVASNFGEHYHTSFDCPSLRLGMISSEPLKGMTVKEAKRSGLMPCKECERMLKEWNEL